MTRLHRLLSLSWADRRLLLEAGLWLGLARAAVMTFPFRWIMRALGQQVGEEIGQTDARVWPQLNRVAWAIGVVSRRTPWQSNCLAQALAGLVMLRWRRIASTLYLGVTKDAEGQLIAHAWLRSHALTVTGGSQLDRYAVVASFIDRA